MKIRVVRPAVKQNTSPDFIKHSIEVTKSYASPGTEIDVVFLDAKPETGPMVGHINEARIRSSSPYVIKEVIRAEREGWDGVYLTGEYDVGAEEARHLVNIPVIDTGPVVVHLAALVGDRIGLITIEDSLRSFTRKLLRRWGVADFVSTIKAWNIPVAEVWSRKEEVKDLTIKICREAVEKDDVNVILPLCGVFVPYIVSPQEIEAAIGVPVINTVAVGLKTTEMFVSLGIGKSQRVYPDTPQSIYMSA